MKIIKVTASTEEKVYNNLLTEVDKKLKNAYSFERYEKRAGKEYVFALDIDNNIIADLEITIQQPRDGEYSAKTKIAI